MSKSKNENRKIKENDIVLIGDKNYKRTDWPLARVVKTIPGHDNVVRVCELKTKNGEFIRPIQKLYPLEVDIGSEDCKNLQQKYSSTDNVKTIINAKSDNLMDVNYD